MSRIEKLRALLPEFELDAMLLTSPASRQYATGLRSSAGVVLITGGESYCITDFRYIEAAKNGARDFTAVMNSAEHPSAALVGERLPPKARLGFEADFMTVSILEAWKKALPAQTFVPAAELPRRCRAVKEPGELEIMAGAQAIAQRAWDDMISGLIRPGVSERSLSAELQYRMMLYGAERMSFEPIVVSGPNSSLPHGVPGERLLQAGDFVTCDFGCVYNGYSSDMTRTVAIGHVTDEMRAVYDLVLRAQEAGINAAKAGVIGSDIDAGARNIIIAAGHGDHFGHGFGHGIGIDVHEPPNANPSEKNPLPLGAVISAEPGVYLPGRFGVRIEDVIVLEKDGCRNLTKASKELLIF